MRNLFVVSILVLVVFLGFGTVFGQQFEPGSSAPPPNSANMPDRDMNAARREPPPQAYTDCVGKKAGDTVQHMTREGVVAATCADSPKGLVARPNRAPGASPSNRSMQ